VIKNQEKIVFSIKTHKNYGKHNKKNTFSVPIKKTRKENGKQKIY